MLVMKVHAVELSMDFSQSLASLRHLLIHAKVRSTTHRLGRTSKPLTVSERLMISMVHLPLPLRVWHNLSAVACCRFRGHRVKVFPMKLERRNATKKVQPRI